MIKKDVLFKWNNTRKEEFEKIKEAIAHAPTLRIHDFTKEFILYTFASDSSFTTILTQKNGEKDEVPISFMRSRLQGVELNYPDIDKKSYVVLKAIKTFKPYLRKSHMKVVVPHSMVKSLLV